MSFDSIDKIEIFLFELIKSVIVTFLIRSAVLHIFSQAFNIFSNINQP